METAITLVNPPDLTLAEDEKGQLSALVQVKLEETKTLTIVSTDEQFETAGEQLKAVAQLRERIKGTLKPSTGRWKRGAVQEARSGAVPKGERGRPAPGGGAASARGRGTAAEAGRGRSQAEGNGGCSREAEARRRSPCRGRGPRGRRGPSNRGTDPGARGPANRGCAGAHAAGARGGPGSRGGSENAESPRRRLRQVQRWRTECGHERANDLKCATCQSVPREYLVLDPKRVQARVNGFGVNANIPGIEVWMDCETSVRRKP